MTEAKANPSDGRIAWGRYLLLFGVAVWMFILGILVGRGTAPVHFDTLALQKELTIMRENMVKKESEAVEKAMRGKDQDVSLGFYEALKNDGPDTTDLTPTPSEKIIAQQSEPPHKSRATLIAKKKDVASSIASSRKGALTIQVAALKDAKTAEQIVANLKKDGYPAYLSRRAVSGKELWFRVRVGRYANESLAAADMARLTLERKNPILLGVD